MRNWFSLDNRESTEFGVYISGGGTYGAPTRSVDMISVPGRDGDLIASGTRQENMELTYPAFIKSDFDENLADLRAWLMATQSYRRLWDTYHQEEYRLAVYLGGLSPNVTPTKRAGKFDITFSVKPQRWLLSGEKVKTFTASGTIKNPTLFRARPLIRIYGAGEVGIGAETITVTAADGYTDIDCDAMESYKDSVSRNTYVRFSGNDYPTIGPGKVDITLGTGITKVEITPRWWTA